ncbi:hypothetical protein LS684_19010 [Cytobacillus spongiae]|uniref:hypothetical protein n=1 Tax=Cytobacillus spongiae TaxID=2901381 RepID=UPI001F430C2B|nr:hypothetical protein [Cytobacillus spongiae]UII55690.1 hypothetical protein LS684_19010 [Cytobacillus spongiae]
MKKLSVGFLILLIFLTSCSKEEGIKKFPVDSLPLEVHVENGVAFERNQSTSSQHELYEDSLLTYDINNRNGHIAKLHLKDRKLTNGDHLVYFKLEGVEENEAKITVRLTFNEANRLLLDDWDQRQPLREHDGTTGTDETTQPIGRFSINQFDETKHEVVLSKQYQSTLLTQDYENGFTSQVREFISEVKNYQIHQEEDSVSLSFQLEANKGELTENWFMLSSEKLFSSTDAMQEYVDIYIDSYKEVTGWLTTDGAIKKLPWSIEPYTKKGYGRNLGMMIDKKAIDQYFLTKERYLYNLMMNSVADLYVYVEEKETDIWETEYTSTWLKKAYGLTAPYIDTRHNEFIALYLSKIGDEFDIPDLQEATLKYGDYLLEQIEAGNVIKTENGLFIADYFSPYDQKQMTHASMNHVLGGANLLLDCYLQSTNDKYLEAARKILRGIEDTQMGWIRPNGDLWYQVNPDLSFAGGDYEQLTLVDLLNHQNKWQEVGEKRSPVIDELISVKTSYLVDQQVKLLDVVIAELRKQGFGQLIK